ncbi:MAG: chromosome partitioning protein ParB [Gammaproteobacteria bacterium]|nr:chromosome partitioning protein ParB [Gammaproteobacteria bacterium]|tara:strand:+ start:16031 stop:16882 length:852 start_codon:yes stop_codon:yes gene_type:complete
MNDKKSSLGKGLDSLLGERKVDSKKDTTEVPLSNMSPGQYQPRRKMHKETLGELSESIKNQGLIQPIVVRKQAAGGFEIVVGERRWRAAKLAGLETVPVVIKNLNNEEAAKIALIENLQREDLNAMDQARALQRLQMEFNLSQEDLAKSLGKSRPAVTNLIRLNKLSEKVQEMLESGEIEMGHARAILSAPKGDQPEIARKVLSLGLSVRETERMVLKSKGDPQTKKIKKDQKDADITKLEKEVSEALGSRVEIKHNKKGSGKLVVSYGGLDQLQGILKKIKR